MMKKFTVIFAVAAIALTASAKQPVFNHLGAGVSVGTNGISIEVATPITDWVQMRAGASFMPGITFNSDAEVSYTAAGMHRTSSVNLKGDLGRTQGQVIFNVYPMTTRIPLYVAVGAYFGGRDLVKITGHSDELEQVGGGDVVIGDYTIPVDSHGNVDGGLRVKSFRPYVGLGWGKAIPGKLLNFSMDLGVQIHGTPELYSKYGTINTADIDDDNTFNKIRDKLKVYPTLTFRLGFRAF